MEMVFYIEMVLTMEMGFEMEMVFKLEFQVLIWFYFIFWLLFQLDGRVLSIDSFCEFPAGATEHRKTVELVDRVLVDYFSSEGAFCLRHRRSFADFNPGWGSLLDTAPCSKSGGDAPI